MAATTRELTHLKEMLRELENSQLETAHAKKEWLAVVDALPDPLFIHDSEYRILRANRAYAERAGMAIREIIGKPYWQVFPKLDGPLPGCVHAQEHVHANEDELCLPSGEVFDIRYCPIKDDKGDYLYSLHIMQDITQRKEAEAQLRLFRDLLDQSSDAIEVIDPVTLRFLDVNATECSDLGYSREELLSMRVTDIDPGFGPAEVAILNEQLEEKGMAVFERMHRRKDGSTFPVEVSLKVIEAGKIYMLASVRDITARVKAEAALRASEERFRTMFDSSHDGILLADAETHKFQLANRRICEMLGYGADELVGMCIEDIHPGDVLPYAIEKFTLHPQAEIEVAVDIPVKRKDNTVFYADINSAPMMVDGRPSLLGVFRDMTARKREEEALRASHDLLNSIVEDVPIRVFWKDRDSRYLGCNTLFARDAGMSHPEEILGKDDFQLTWRDQAERYHADDKRVMDSGMPKLDYEESQTLADGHTLWVRASKVPLRDADGKVFGMVGIYDDITARKETEVALQRSQASLVEAQRIAQLGSWEHDLVNGKLVWSDEIYRMFGLDPEAFEPSYETFLAAVHPEDRDQINNAYSRHVKEHAPYDLEHRILLADGRIRYVHEKCETLFEGNRPLRSLGTVQDITDRKQAELELRRAMRAQRALSVCNGILVHATQEQQLLADMCRAVIEDGGYRLAWIGVVEHDEAKSIRTIISAGYDDGYLDTLNLTWADTEHGQGPTGRAVRSGMPQVAENILADPQYAPWREQALKRGYASSIALPLKEEDGKVFGVMSIYAVEPKAFDKAELLLLEELAGDLAFGVMALRTRQERNHYQQEHLKSAERLKRSLTDTIRVIALTVEKRDPYTAGHQSRVAELATAIARELGLNEDRIEGLRLGATIHDIGKVYIPAEILNRPGRPTDIEFEMIKSHPTVGYDIIKDVQFPWPVADMILQHHERMDGSGYPKGLRGEEIILEARILSVADVVEAITAHRPYRPAIGLEAALTEIEANRGKLYDAKVVDACLRLFREHGFLLEGSI